MENACQKPLWAVCFFIRKWHYNMVKGSKKLILHDIRPLKEGSSDLIELMFENSILGKEGGEIKVFFFFFKPLRQFCLNLKTGLKKLESRI